MSNLIKNNSKPWSLLINDYKTNHVAHAYLFYGLEGLGKKSIAKEYIKYMLDANAVLSKRIEEENFLDLLYLKKQDKNEITIDQIRKAHDFFNQTPAESKYKFVIIDAIDDLNLNAANALLKILEEPTANTHLFLINHALGKTLPTIRSRCRIISFKPIEIDNIFEDLVAGSPGKAVQLENKSALKLYEQLLQIINTKDILAFNKFADNLNKKPEQWTLITDLLIFLINRCIKFSANSLEKIMDIENDILPVISKSNNLEQWFNIYDEAQEMLNQNEIFNLDKKQVLFIILNSISKF